MCVPGHYGLRVEIRRQLVKGYCLLPYGVGTKLSLTHPQMVISMDKHGLVHQNEKNAEMGSQHSITG